MEIKKKIVVPTGEIYTAIGEKGMLEFLTVGDYGKNANIKADFLGITRDLNGVPNGEPMPLTEKWVITISTQYGCSMGCKFCDVPKVGIGRNATFNDLKGEVLTAQATPGSEAHETSKHTLCTYGRAYMERKCVTSCNQCKEGHRAVYRRFFGTPGYKYNAAKEK